MKKIMFLLLISTSILMAGCSKKEKIPQWEGSEVMGEIDENAEIADTNDFLDQMDIDTYMKIEEMNMAEGGYNWDNYRTHYNRIAQQLGMNILDSKPGEIAPSLDGAVTYTISDSQTNNIITLDEKTKEIYHIYTEHAISIKEDGNSYGEAMAKLMPAIYAGVPKMKKFDLNQVYMGIRDTLQENTGSYSYEFNGYCINVTRKTNLASITIYKPEFLNIK